jgi:hypothetical protein
MTLGTTSQAGTAISAAADDVVLVPRSVLMHILSHVLAGHRRVPTRHLSQAIQRLHHILGINN